MEHDAVSVTHAELEAAESRGQARQSAGPTIVAAWYDVTRRLLLTQMLDGVVLGVPVDRFASLATFDDDALCRLRVAPSGLLLFWEDPDADLSIEEVLAHALASPGMLRELARTGGRVRSEPKARAARANGALGGRPRKIL
jgi:hypothetical protein